MCGLSLLCHCLHQWYRVEALVSACLYFPGLSQSDVALLPKLRPFFIDSVLVSSNGIFLTPLQVEGEILMKNRVSATWALVAD